MEGNIVYVNYELSSWQHMNDDIVDTEQKKSDYSSSKNYRVVKYGGYIESNHQRPFIPDNRIVKHTGYVVQLGAGSAYGGKWVPKNPETERFLGQTGEIKTTYDKGYQVDTKIGENGKAIVERHYTDHGKPWAHSNPHDHYIKWDSPDAHPEVQGPTNYQGDIPEFKGYRGVSNMPVYSYKNSPKDNRFKTIAEFQPSIRWGSEIAFEYKNKIYSITRENEKINISEAYKQEAEANYDDCEDLLNHMIEGKKLREIITEVTVTDRTI